MPRRRYLYASLCLLVVICSVGLFRSNGVTYSRDECQLIGRWTTPEPNPSASFITASGPVASPVRVWELRPDRTFRVWITSASDPKVSILDNSTVTDFS